MPTTISPIRWMDIIMMTNFIFFMEPLEIVGREVKRLKRSQIPLVKVRWNSKRGPEFTWEREDQFEKKYPHLFTKTTPSSSTALLHLIDSRDALFVIYLALLTQGAIGIWKNPDKPSRKQSNIFSLSDHLDEIIMGKDLSPWSVLTALIRRIESESSAALHSQLSRSDYSIDFSTPFNKNESVVSFSSNSWAAALIASSKSSTP
ncbi:hypothetical protein Tco_0085214 [Tanacetum coccineum]